MSNRFPLLQVRRRRRTPCRTPILSGDNAATAAHTAGKSVSDPEGARHHASRREYPHSLQRLKDLGTNAFTLRLISRVVLSWLRL
jgi:hypothetical protein